MPCPERLQDRVGDWLQLQATTLAANFVLLQAKRPSNPLSGHMHGSAVFHRVLNNAARYERGWLVLLSRLVSP